MESEFSEKEKVYGESFNLIMKESFMNSPLERVAKIVEAVRVSTNYDLLRFIKPVDLRSKEDIAILMENTMYIPLFTHFPEVHGDFCRSANLVLCEDEETLFEKGDPANRYYILAHGTICIQFLKSTMSLTQEVVEVVTGASIGELGIISEPHKRSGTAFAKKKEIAVLLTLNLIDYNRLLRQYHIDIYFNRLEFWRHVNTICFLPLPRMIPMTYYTAFKKYARGEIVCKPGDKALEILWCATGRFLVSVPVLEENNQIRYVCSNIINPGNMFPPPIFSSNYLVKIQAVEESAIFSCNYKSFTASQGLLSQFSEYSALERAFQLGPGNRESKDIEYIRNLIDPYLPKLCPNLSNISADFLAANCKLMRYRAGEILYRKGDPGEYFYVVLDGQVDLCISEQSGAVQDKKSIKKLRRAANNYTDTEANIVFKKCENYFRNIASNSNNVEDDPYSSLVSDEVFRPFGVAPLPGKLSGIANLSMKSSISINEPVKLYDELINEPFIKSLYPILLDEPRWESVIPKTTGDFFGEDGMFSELPESTPFKSFDDISKLINYVLEEYLFIILFSIIASLESANYGDFDRFMSNLSAAQSSAVRVSEFVEENLSDILHFLLIAMKQCKLENVHKSALLSNLVDKLKTLGRYLFTARVETNSTLLVLRRRDYLNVFGRFHLSLSRKKINLLKQTGIFDSISLNAEINANSIDSVSKVLKIFKISDDIEYPPVVKTSDFYKVKIERVLNARHIEHPNQKVVLNNQDIRLNSFMAEVSEYVHSLFGFYSPREIERFSQFFVSKFYTSGTSIISEGVSTTISDQGLFIILSGEVEVRQNRVVDTIDRLGEKHSKKCSPLVISKLEAGSMFEYGLSENSMGITDIDFCRSIGKCLKSFYKLQQSAENKLHDFFISPTVISNNEKSSYPFESHSFLKEKAKSSSNEVFKSQTTQNISDLIPIFTTSDINCILFARELSLRKNDITLKENRFSGNIEAICKACKDAVPSLTFCSVTPVQILFVSTADILLYFPIEVIGKILEKIMVLRKHQHERISTLQKPWNSQLKNSIRSTLENSLIKTNLAKEQVAIIDELDQTKLVRQNADTIHQNSPRRRSTVGTCSNLVHTRKINVDLNRNDIENSKTEHDIQQEKAIARKKQSNASKQRVLERIDPRLFSVSSLLQSAKQKFQSEKLSKKNSFKRILSNSILTKETAKFVDDVVSTNSKIILPEPVKQKTVEELALEVLENEYQEKVANLLTIGSTLASEHISLAQPIRPSTQSNTSRVLINTLEHTRLKSTLFVGKFVSGSDSTTDQIVTTARRHLEVDSDFIKIPSVPQKQIKMKIDSPNKLCLQPTSIGSFWTSSLQPKQPKSAISYNKLTKYKIKKELMSNPPKSQTNIFRGILGEFKS